jgi:hypothetical protein
LYICICIHQEKQTHKEKQETVSIKNESNIEKEKRDRKMMLRRQEKRGKKD